MAGQKKLWASHATYDAVGEEKILEMRASGMSVRNIVEACRGTPRQLYHWFDKGVGADEPGELGVTRRLRWEAAGRIGAEALVDKSAAAFSDLREPITGRMLPDVSREELSLNKIESDYSKFRAGTQDPERFKEMGRGNTQISIGQLHLSAVKRVLEGRKHTTEALGPGETAPRDGFEEDDIIDAEAELVSTVHLDGSTPE